MAFWLIVIFLLLLISGLPIAFALAVTALAMFYIYDLASLTTLAHYMYSALYNFTLIALPFFIVVGVFLGGGLSKYLFNFANSFLKNIRGGIGIAVVFTSVVFAAISGSSLANAAALGILLLPTMVEFGYPRGFSAALIATGGTLGVLIPPSLTMIVYSVLTEQSVGELFLAGVVPGLIISVMLAIVVWLVYPRLVGIQREREPIFASEIWGTFKQAIPVLVAPVIILGGIYGGIFTPEESAAVAVVYCLVITVFYYRTIPLSRLFEVFEESTITASSIMFILAGAIAFSYVVTVAQIPNMVMEAMTQSGLPLPAIILLVNVALLIMGCFLDVFSIMMITVPILYLPLVQLGVDPIVLGVTYTINMEVGTITPPVGMNLVALSGATGVPVEEIARSSVYFYIVLLLGIFLVVSIPELSTWLPSLLMR